MRPHVVYLKRFHHPCENAKNDANTVASLRCMDSVPRLTSKGNLDKL